MRLAIKKGRKKIKIVKLIRNSFLIDELISFVEYLKTFSVKFSLKKAFKCKLLKLEGFSKNGAVAMVSMDDGSVSLEQLFLC